VVKTRLSLLWNVAKIFFAKDPAPECQSFSTFIFQFMLKYFEVSAAII